VGSAGHCRSLDKGRAVKPYTWMRKVRDSDLPAMTKAVAWALGLRADQTCHSWPSYARLSKDTGMHRASVVRHIQVLAEAGWVMVVNRSNKHGRQSNSYMLMNPVDKGLPSSTERQGVVAEDDGGSRTERLPGGSHSATRKKSPIEERQSEDNGSPQPTGHLAAVVGSIAKGMRMP
jgi:hypothetical protein